MAEHGRRERESWMRVRLQSSRRVNLLFFSYSNPFFKSREEKENQVRERESRVSQLPLREARAHEYPEYHDYARESERRKTCESGCLTRLLTDVRQSQQIIPSLTCLPSIVCPCFPPSIIRSIILSLSLSPLLLPVHLPRASFSVER